MDPKIVTETLVDKLLHSKSGPNNIRMAYTIGFLQSVLTKLLKESPDATIRLWHQVEKMGAKNETFK
jgi:hypothetical protein